MKKGILILLLLILAGAVYIKRDELVNRIRHTVSKIERPPGKLEAPIDNEVTLPGTLRALENAVSKTPLTSNGVITQTNKERATAGLLSLKENSKLRQAAEAKLQDMFEQQYFEHVSPDGLGPSDLAKTAGYEYILVGENLALGNFENDTALVTAWMNSPGHRANILNKKYTEIGVAVGQGLYEGKKTWLAVQEFGAPLSTCPAVDTQLKTTINQNQKQINTLEAELTAKREALEAQRNTDPEGYNKEVVVYNRMVGEVNNLIDQTKTLVKNYNAQVNAFNACIKS